MQPEFPPRFLFPWLHNISSNLLVHTFTHFSTIYSSLELEYLSHDIQECFSSCHSTFSKLAKLNFFFLLQVLRDLVLWWAVQWIRWAEVIRGFPLAIWAGDHCSLLEIPQWGRRMVRPPPLLGKRWHWASGLDSPQTLGSWFSLSMKVCLFSCSYLFIHLLLDLTEASTLGRSVVLRI